MRTLTGLVLVATVVLASCNPYVAAVSVTYGALTDERSIGEQASDTEIEAKIKSSLVASPVPGTATIDVFCRQGVVVVAGVVPPGSQAGRTAVDIARSTSGVSRVETFFVASEPSETADVETAGKIKAMFIADPNVVADRVSVEVYAGHVVLVGVVSGPEQIDRFIDDANSVDDVVSVRSYIQVAGQ